MIHSKCQLLEFYNNFRKLFVFSWNQFYFVLFSFNDPLILCSVTVKSLIFNERGSHIDQAMSLRMIWILTTMLVLRGTGDQTQSPVNSRQVLYQVFYTPAQPLPFIKYLRVFKSTDIDLQISICMLLLYFNTWLFKTSLTK